mmetsp:Transcript_9588/g.12005  ORF Transcript_9588/g.12005 Transcript_9588/m.12005 type:complete len:308 (-) Transcript_9588:104-1027(-)
MATFDDGIKPSVGHYDTGNMPQSSAFETDTNDFDNTVQKNYGDSDDSWMSEVKNRSFYYGMWLIIYCIFSWAFMSYIYSARIAGGVMFLTSIIICCVVKCCYCGCARALGLLLMLAGIGYIAGPVIEFAMAVDGSEIGIFVTSESLPFFLFILQFVVGIILVPSIICIITGLDLLTGLLNNQKLRILVTALTLVITCGIQAYANSEELLFEGFKVALILCIAFALIALISIILCILIFCMPLRLISKIGGGLITLFGVVVFAANGFFWAQLFQLTDGFYGDSWILIFASFFIYPALYIALGIGLLLE